MIVNIIIDRCIETPVDAHTLSDRWIPQEGVKSDSRLKDCGFHRSATTPPKFNMEPQNDESLVQMFVYPFQMGDFQVPAVSFRGVNQGLAKRFLGGSFPM